MFRAGTFGRIALSAYASIIRLEVHLTLQAYPLLSIIYTSPLFYKTREWANSTLHRKHDAHLLHRMREVANQGGSERRTRVKTNFLLHPTTSISCGHHGRTSATIMCDEKVSRRETRGGERLLKKKQQPHLGLGNNALLPCLYICFLAVETCCMI